jgi:hypothetical protein
VRNQNSGHRGFPFAAEARRDDLEMKSHSYAVWM